MLAAAAACWAALVVLDEGLLEGLLLELDDREDDCELFEAVIPLAPYIICCKAAACKAIEAGSLAPMPPIPILINAATC